MGRWFDSCQWKGNCTAKSKSYLGWCQTIKNWLTRQDRKKYWARESCRISRWLTTPPWDHFTAEFGVTYLSEVRMSFSVASGPSIKHGRHQWAYQRSRSSGNSGFHPPNLLRRRRTLYQRTELWWSPFVLGFTRCERLAGEIHKPLLYRNIGTTRCRITKKRPNLRKKKRLSWQRTS